MTESTTLRLSAAAGNCPPTVLPVSSEWLTVANVLAVARTIPFANFFDRDIPEMTQRSSAAARRQIECRWSFG